MNFEKLTELVIELEVDDIADAVKEALSEGKEAFDILNSLTKGMDEVGRRYEEKEYYLTELVLAGETMKEAFNILKPALAASDKSEDKVKIILATVKGDNHDIGKNIVKAMLEVNGYEVTDLGVDVSTQMILKTARETNTDIIALSALMIPSLPFVKDVIEFVTPHDEMKVIVGGGPVSKDWAIEAGADGYGDDAIQAVDIVKQLLN